MVVGDFISTPSPGVEIYLPKGVTMNPRLGSGFVAILSVNVALTALAAICSWIRWYRGRPKGWLGQSLDNIPAGALEDGDEESTTAGTPDPLIQRCSGRIRVAS